MDLKELRQLIEREGGKVIVVEEGEPVLIVSVYQSSPKKSREIMKTEKVENSQPAPENELSVDDLPF